MKHSLDALHMSPYLLATAAALVSAVTAMPALRTGIGLRRWYQPLLLSALGILGIAIIGTVIISSPWLALGLAMLALLVGSVLHTLHRTAGHADEEALNFTQALVNVMAADLDLLQALREIVRSSDFNRTCPHATAQARMIVSEVDAGRRLSASVPYVTGGAPAEYRQIWRQIESLARMIEEDRLGLEAQRETLRSFWEILLEVHETNRAMRRIPAIIWVISVSSLSE